MVHNKTKTVMSRYLVGDLSNGRILRRSERIGWEESLSESSLGRDSESSLGRDGWPWSWDDWFLVSTKLKIQGKQRSYQ